MIPIPDPPRMRAQIVLHEGKAKRKGSRYVCYQDSVGVWTIGVGRNLQHRGLSEAEVDLLLDNDLKDHWNDLLIAFPWVERLDTVRQRALLDMGFNLGIPRLKTFKRTLASIERGDYETAAVEMLESKWAEQVGDRALRLAEMVRSGTDYVT